MGFIKSSAKIEVHGNTSLPQEEREILNKQLNLILKATKKRRTTTTTKRMFIEGKKI